MNTLDTKRGTLKHNRRKRRLWTAVLVLASLVFVVSLGVLVVIGWGYMSSSRLYDEVAQSANIATEANALEEMTVDWDALYEQNPDTVAWLYIPGSVIDYPVVQGEDDEEYLKTDFSGNTGGLVNLGAVFLSVINDGDFSNDNNFLYAHRSGDGTMFGTLVKMQDQEVFDELRTLYVFTPTRNYRCVTIALDVVAYTEVSILQPSFSDAEAMVDYLQNRVDESAAVADDVDLSSFSKIFTLITCENTDATTRAVLFAGVVESAVPSNAEVSADDA